ncbi:MAG: putative L-galactonate transporter [Steroidobacteraceae bacterium]|nr:putative L-galactonate transporter [Steroidobacteraceae bacterium]
MRTSIYGWYVVTVLALANAISFVDRLVLSLLVTPIKAELRLSDTQVSLLQGFAFALFYCVAGVLLARLADRTSRKWIVTAGITLWCLMTTLSGTARHYWQLFLCRFGVGIGEGTLSPSAYSLIAGYFPRERLSLAIGVFSIGITAGIGLAWLGGGAVIHWVSTRGVLDLPGLPPLEGWRLVFALLGALGLPVAALMLAVREPPRLARSTPARARDVLAQYRRHGRRYSYVMFGYGATSITIYAVMTWSPTFYLRHYGATITEAATALGLVALVGGVIGGWFGGALADRLEQRGDAHAKVRVLHYSVIGLVLPAVVAPFMPTMQGSAFVLAFTFLFGAACTGPAGAFVQSITPESMRAQFGAIYLLALTLVGATLGPLLTALFTDYVFRDEASLGKSLAAVSLAGNLLALWLVRQAWRTETTAVQSAVEPVA